MRSPKYSDIKGSYDRGPREFKSHVVDRSGDVMLVAERNVVSTHPLNTIKNVAEIMGKHDFRRIPITNAGTGRLEGMAVAIDILDFLGGGEKYNIIAGDYGGNFLSAINGPISKIMNTNPSFLDKRASIDDVVKIMLEKRTSCIPLVDDKRTREVIAVVTERDVLPSGKEFGVTVGDYMKEDVITSSLGMMISDVSKVMVRNRLRRLPVISDEQLVGVVTVFDILKFLGKADFKGIDAEENLSARVEEVMEKKIISVRRNQDLADVCRLVRETGYGGFPVEDAGGLVGIITTTDVLNWAYGIKK